MGVIWGCLPIQVRPGEGKQDTRQMLCGVETEGKFGLNGSMKVKSVVKKWRVLQTVDTAKNIKGATRPTILKVYVP